MPSASSALVVIPARAGSRRLPGKNNLVLAGRPMLAYTLDAVAEARSVAYVVVVTDDARFKRTAEDLGIAVIDEPPELAGDTSPVFPAIEYATVQIESRLDRTFGQVVICDPNVPIRPAGIIDQVVAALIADPTVDLAISVEPCGRRHPDWAVSLDPDGIAHFPGIPAELSQELPPRFFVTSAAHALRRNSISCATMNYLRMRLCGVVHAPDGALDIDTAEAIPFIEFLLSQHQSREQRAMADRNLAAATPV